MKGMKSVLALKKSETAIALQSATSWSLRDSISVTNRSVPARAGVEQII
jgi:hypothetical protein